MPSNLIPIGAAEVSHVGVATEALFKTSVILVVNSIRIDSGCGSVSAMDGGGTEKKMIQKIGLVITESQELVLL